jgi:acetyl esterase
LPAIEAPRIEIESLEDHFVQDIPIRIYNSNQTKKPCIYYIPGGAFIAGNLDTHDNIVRYLAKELGSVIVSVDYRKAPKHKFPSAINDVETVFNWIKSNSNRLNIDLNKIVLMGDSAGGNFSAVMAQKYKEDLLAQVLINPGLDLTPNGSGFESLSFFIDWYLEDLKESGHPDVSPIYADSFEGLPQTVIITCEYDTLKQDGDRYKKKLEASNVEVKCKDFEGFAHLACQWAGRSPDTAEIQDYVVAQMKRILE